MNRRFKLSFIGYDNIKGVIPFKSNGVVHVAILAVSHMSLFQASFLPCVSDIFFSRGVSFFLLFILHYIGRTDGIPD